MGGTEKAVEAESHRSVNAEFVNPSTVSAISIETVCEGTWCIQTEIWATSGR